MSFFFFQTARVTWCSDARNAGVRKEHHMTLIVYCKVQCGSLYFSAIHFFNPVSNGKVYKLILIFEMFIMYIIFAINAVFYV